MGAERLFNVVKANIFPFPGRGQGAVSNEVSSRIIECTRGTVLALIVFHGRVGFVHSFCRKAVMDRWEIYCYSPFTRMSNASFTRSWAEPLKKELFVFRAARLEIVPEQEWMRKKR